jgi:hypothetical protein
VQREPDVLAHQLALLIDGAIVATKVSHNPGVTDSAGLAAYALFARLSMRQTSGVPPQLVAV